MARKHDSLRDWAEPSYDKRTGRSASSLESADGGGRKGNHTTEVADQVEETMNGGQNGAPGVSAMNRSGSADPGRNKWGASKVS